MLAFYGKQQLIMMIFKVCASKRGCQRQLHEPLEFGRFVCEVGFCLNPLLLSFVLIIITHPEFYRFLIVFVTRLLRSNVKFWVSMLGVFKTERERGCVRPHSGLFQEFMDVIEVKSSTDAFKRFTACNSR